MKSEARWGGDRCHEWMFGGKRKHDLLAEIRPTKPPDLVLVVARSDAHQKVKKAPEAPVSTKAGSLLAPWIERLQWF